MSYPRPVFEPRSRFLTIPLGKVSFLPLLTVANWKTCVEIRRNIYRILLLDPPETYLSTPWEQQSADLYEALTEAPWVRKTIWKLREGYDDLDLSIRRYPNILRINRQIYSEASSILYSELRVNLQPGDVLCMKTGKDIAKASEKVWRHNPLDGIGTTDETGQTVYSKPRLDGVMEPHVLAHFKKFAFELDINWEVELDQRLRENHTVQPSVPPSLFVHENMTVDPQDEANLLAFYRKSTLIHQLVKILSNSPDIVSLHVSFDFRVYVRDCKELDAYYHEAEDFKKVDLANERAMEIYMDGGFFAPLEGLSNVRSLEFQFIQTSYDGEDYEPKERHERMLTDLKQKIKDNYARQHQ